MRHEEFKQFNQGCVKNAVNSAGSKHELNTLIIRVANALKKKVDPKLVSFNSCSALPKK